MAFKLVNGRIEKVAETVAPAKKEAVKSAVKKAEMKVGEKKAVIVKVEAKKVPAKVEVKKVEAKPVVSDKQRINVLERKVAALVTKVEKLAAAKTKKK